MEVNAMFSWNDFVSGSNFVKINDEIEFGKFMELCGNKGLKFLNSKVCGTENLECIRLESNGRFRNYLLNEDNVKRYTFGVCNYYVVINGTVRKKTRNSSALENKQGYEIFDIMSVDFIDEEGYEREIY